jgi:hypothetical protein
MVNATAGNELTAKRRNGARAVSSPRRAAMYGKRERDRDSHFDDGVKTTMQRI